MVFEKYQNAIEKNMYILTFNRSRSKYFKKGLDLAELPLFEIIQNWSSTCAKYNGRKVENGNGVNCVYLASLIA